ncbi:hypothetical protein KEJ34_00180 [Candidatus Bathyarchaeota archaeon]|nr:hypothetical protein [Candidatus Bathyarchaeota archaeon]
MGNPSHHAKIAEENFRGALAELENGRFSNVGLLCLRALEQMIEACASKEHLHFHEHPRIAHMDRRSWLKAHHPDLLVIWDQLWGIYGALGYGGQNGERAEQALTMLKKCLGELSKREKIEIGGL